MGPFEVFGPYDSMEDSYAALKKWQERYKANAAKKLYTVQMMQEI